MQLDVAPSIPLAFKKRVERAPAEILFSSITCKVTGSGRNFRDFDHLDLSCQEVLARSSRVAHYLLSCGVCKGQRVAIMSDKRAEFSIAALGVLMTGASVVLIYPTDTDKDLAFKIWDTKPKLIFADSLINAQKVISATSQTYTFKQPEDLKDITTRLPALAVISFDTFNYSALQFDQSGTRREIIGFSTITQNRNLSESLPEAAHSITPSDEAYIVYTGGTTGGTPKGVIHTHGGRIANVSQMSQLGLYQKGWNTFLGLNLAHAYLQIIQDVCLMDGMCGVFPAVLGSSDICDPTQLRETNRTLLIASMAKAKAHVIPVVPELLQVVEKKVRANGLLRTLNHGIFRTIGFGRYSIAGSIVRRKLVGPNFQHFISGGGPLSDELVDSYRRYGIVVYNGYGSSEGNVVIAVGSPTNNRKGTVGKVAPSNEARLVADEDGVLVLQVRGPSIASSYLNRPVASSQTFLDGGWLNTHDTAEIDADGFITLRGRADDVLILTTGENVYPAEIEERLKYLEFIQDAVVVGHGQHFPGALLALDRIKLEAWAKSEKHTLTPVLNEDPKVRDLIKSELDAFNSEANRGGRNHIRIEKFHLVDEPFSIDNELRSRATFKILRSKVLERYATQITRLYLQQAC